MIKLEAGRYLIALPLLISKIFPSDQLSSASLTKKGTGQKAEGFYECLRHAAHDFYGVRVSSPH